jgi:hypothetical protein
MEMNMKQERRKVLEMLSSGELSVDEADELLGSFDTAKAGGCAPKFLRLTLEPKAGGDSDRKIDIRVPLGVLRSSLQIAQSLPMQGRGQMTIALGTHTLAFNVSSLNTDNMDEFLAQFRDLSTDIDREKETLRLFCE